MRRSAYSKVSSAPLVEDWDRHGHPLRARVGSQIDASNGRRGRPLWALSPMVGVAAGDDDLGMNRASHLHDRASDLVEAAQGFEAAAEEPTSHAAAPDALAALEEALQVLSAAWYLLAADASPGSAGRRRARGREPRSHDSRDGLSREQEAHLMATLHDIAAAFASCARACRDGRSTAAPIIGRRLAAMQITDQSAEDEVSWFESREPPTERVA
jgi:hypothetical protein